MKRIPLFELEDFTWFPGFLRDYGTDFLNFLANNTKIYQPVIPVLRKAIQREGTHKIIDLASGGGGGWIRIRKELKKSGLEPTIVLTDYFPNLDAFKYAQSQADKVEYVEFPVDARNVPRELSGLRTLFLSFHHFNPEDAKRILQDAVDSKSGIAIFEGQERSFSSLLAMFLSPISVWLTTPFIRPFRIGRLFFTYILPIVPLFVWWDGIVSALRTYSVREMEELVAEVKNKNSFQWEIKRIKSGPTAVLYCVGAVKRKIIVEHAKPEKMDTH